MKKKTDCPMAPVGDYMQGSAGTGHPARTVSYVPPCKNWDGTTGICHWYNPPQKVSELLAFIKKEDR